LRNDFRAAIWAALFPAAKIAARQKCITLAAASGYIIGAQPLGACAED
jgi:hypothetical protein